MSDRLIKLSDAIKAVWKPQVKPNELIFDALKQAIESEIRNCPTVDDRSQGEWKAVSLIMEIDEAPTIKTKEVKYFDEDEKAWKIGEVIVDE